MSGTGNCYDNAMVETFFKTLKSELVWRTVFYTRQEADQAIGRYIDGFYNPVRRHSALDFTSPAQLAKTAGGRPQCLSTKAGQVHRHLWSELIAQLTENFVSTHQSEVSEREWIAPFKGELRI